MFNETQIKELPDFQGVANDMGDFFLPSDCLEHIVARQGLIKHKDKGRVWCLMAATKIGGNLNLVTYYREAKFYGDWESSTMMATENFVNLIKTKYRIDV